LSVHLSVIFCANEVTGESTRTPSSSNGGRDGLTRDDEADRNFHRLRRRRIEERVIVARAGRPAFVER
jgi:hypothetical protein